jgi:hypothetical protein
MFVVNVVSYQRSLRRADHSSRGVRSSVVRLSVIEGLHRRGLGPQGAVEP